MNFLKRQISQLLHYANSSPPLIGRREFYALKSRQNCIGAESHVFPNAVEFEVHRPILQAIRAHRRIPLSSLRSDTYGSEKASLLSR